MNNHIRVRPESRLLPTRLAVNEIWESWLPISQIPEQFRHNAYDCFRVRLSTGEVFVSSKEDTVPPIGSVPGGGILASDIAALNQ
jgi:hypothetical protein